jgi:hypothetical protein
MKRARVNVTIDRLVLRGFAPGHKNGIAAGLQAELQRQFSDPAVAGGTAASRSIAAVQAAPLTLTRETKPERIGTTVAQRVARSVRS